MYCEKLQHLLSEYFVKTFSQLPRYQFLIDQIKKC